MQQTQEQIEKLRTLQEQLDSALHETAQESTLLAESAAIKQAIADKPEVDLSGVAKQGENAEATNTKILEEIGNMANALTALNDTLGTL